MRLPRGLSEVPPQLALVRVVLLAAALAGMLSSVPVWLNSRLYPPLPIASWFPVLPPPLDKVLLSFALMSLVLACWRYRPAVISFLASSLFLYLEDQNRGQPWLYTYWVMLLLTLSRAPVALAGCQLALSAVYVWSGLQKCNPNFGRIIPSWFVSPASGWGLPEVATALMERAVAWTPLIEILLGLLLWGPRTRRLALGGIAALHGAALLFLGPLGHKYNFAVWPWNLAMVALAAALFGPRPSGRLRDAAVELTRSKAALGVVLLFWCLPVLSFWGWWDSYFSFSLYSANLAAADVYLTKQVQSEWPARLRPFVRPVRPPQPALPPDSLLFDYTNWSMKELGVPLLPEPRSYRAMFRYLVQHTTTVRELRMILQPRHGPLILYQGDESFVLPPPTPPQR